MFQKINNCVSIHNSVGHKDRLQKQLMIMNLSEGHHIFIRANFTILSVVLLLQNTVLSVVLLLQNTVLSGLFLLQTSLLLHLLVHRY